MTTNPSPETVEIDALIAFTRNRELLVKTFIANPRTLMQALTALADEVVCLRAALAAAPPSAGEGWRPTCETCRHWKFAEDDWEFDGLRMGKCARIQMRQEIADSVTFPEGVERWDEAGEKLVGAAMLASKAIAVDGSGYYAAIRTAPDFGCTLHEPAAAPSPPVEKAK